MKKEEILQTSRNENKNKDIFELEIISKGQRIGGMIAISITVILLLLEQAILDIGTNYGYFCIILSAVAGMWIYKAVKLKRKHEILLAVLMSILTVYAGVMAVLSFVG